MACNSRSSRCSANVAAARALQPTAGGALSPLLYFFGVILYESALRDLINWELYNEVWMPERRGVQCPLSR